MFNRKLDSYILQPGVLDSVLNDEANPLFQISQQVTSGATVLDVGAGNGLLALVFKALNKNIVIDGIEPNELAAQIARENYREIFVGFLEDYINEINFLDYDYIVIADVIEHTQDPFSFLNQITTRISNKTKVLISVPNIAYAATRFSLYQGNFNYVDSGILERTHLRFFTYKTALDLISHLKINLNEVVFLQRPFYKSEVTIKFQNIFDILALLGILIDKFAYPYQFLFVLSFENGRTVFSKKGRKFHNPLSYIKKLQKSSLRISL